MTTLTRSVLKLLVAVKLATANDAKYLRALNLQALQKTKGKPSPGENPRTFYQALQKEAEEGPIFLKKTLDFFDKLTLELHKNEIQWLATRYQQNDKIRAEELPSLIDYVRAENPDLSKLKYTDALRASQQWHQQFRGKENIAGPYKTKNVVLAVGNHSWVDVPANDLETEGDLMGHCVGGDEYRDEVKAGKIKIYSLRDGSNKPHVTVELKIKGNRIIQVQGKENKQPIAKYHAAIEKLIEHLAIEHTQHTIRYVSDPAKLAEIAENPKLADSVAGNPNITLELMRKLLNHDDVEVVAFLASNVAIPVDIMGVLAKNDDDLVQRNLARNPNLLVELMKGILKNKESYVRSSLAQNENLPVELMLTLATDQDVSVKRILSRRHDLPRKAMNILAKDVHGVRRSLANNKQLPVEIMKILANDEDEDVRCHLADNPSIPLEIMKILAKDKSDDVRGNLVDNPSIPDDLKAVVKNSLRSVA